MERRGLYCTADAVGTETGGGKVTYNELIVMKSVCQVVEIIERKDVDCNKWRQTDSPFLQDYIALQQIKDKHFDLAHFYSGCFTETIRYLKDRGTKVSYTVAAHDRKLSIEEFHRLGLEYPYHYVSDDGLWKIYTEGIRLADIVIAPSKKSAQILESMGCKNIKVIPHGIVWPKKVKPIPENFDCLYLGATGPDKGLLYLIQAWGMLNYPDSKLILAGSGTESLEPFIRQVTDKGNFAIMGRVSDVADVYNACSVYIQPSVSEGFGIEIPEAMSYARPVIASEGAGASEIIIDGRTGFVVPIRNPQAIAEKIDWLKTHKDDQNWYGSVTGKPHCFTQLLYMGAKAKQTAAQYVWSRIRRRYARLFSSLQARGYKP